MLAAVWGTAVLHAGHSTPRCCQLLQSCMCLCLQACQPLRQHAGMPLPDVDSPLSSLVPSSMAADSTSRALPDTA